MESQLNVRWLTTLYFSILRVKCTKHKKLGKQIFELQQIIQWMVYLQMLVKIIIIQTIKRVHINYFKNNKEKKLKYFTKEWNENGCDPINTGAYNKYMEDNYDYYPKWYKKHNVLQSGEFVFHDAKIDGIKCEDDGTVIIEFKGTLTDFDLQYKLICVDAKINPTLDITKSYYVVAEEFYCDKDKKELCFLVENDDNEQEYLSVEAKQIDFKYHKFAFFQKTKVKEIVNILMKTIVCVLFGVLGYILAKL